MIIQHLMNSIYNIMDFLLWFEIPKLPPEVFDYVETAFDYIEAGAGVLANYVPLPYFMTLFALLLTIDACIVVYHLVMWIIRKIPMLGME